MNSAKHCNSIAEVRAHIDQIDKELVALIASRGGYAKQAARFKKTAEEVQAPQRVEQVISKVKAFSLELGANPGVTERVYRAMIEAFIEIERAEHAALGAASQPR
ncbi:chorismate mutase [Pseudomonas sp. R5(2019)]|uniref:chorismate mutase n=1 Tax=Pseudomonas sp. R5(2019) TaxID=2697566 RepID=UPI0014126FB4|nr:chorismate mutase [Pseudomonas sp. R5(2019)]NBA96581.1 chorismate mutase [Pseudomonas sp. R5(2019)]